MAIYGLFSFIYLIFKTIYRIKTVELSGIRTRINEVDGKPSDLLTTVSTHIFFLQTKFTFKLTDWPIVM